MFQRVLPHPSLKGKGGKGAMFLAMFFAASVKNASDAASKIFRRITRAIQRLAALIHSDVFWPGIQRQPELLGATARREFGFDT